MLKKYMMFNHQGKGDKYENILSLQYEKVERPPVDIVFSDQAIYGRKQKLKRMDAQCYFIYPHSGYPNITSDIEPLWRWTTAEFVASEGHREIMRLYGHDKPIHVLGWHLCDLKRYRPTNVVNVLFAPIHPRCHEIDKEVNRRAFNMLKDLDINLTVRYIHSLEDSGLERLEKPNISYTEGQLVPSVDQIDDADVVVGYETFLTLAVARGVPALSFGADMPTHLIPYAKPDGVWPKNWYAYLPFLRYPLDLFDGSALDMLERAAKSDEDIRGWRSRMVGDKTFDADKLINRVERYL